MEFAADSRFFRELIELTFTGLQANLGNYRRFRYLLGEFLFFPEICSVLLIRLILFLLVPTLDERLYMAVTKVCISMDVIDFVLFGATSTSQIHSTIS